MEQQLVALATSKDGHEYEILNNYEGRVGIFIKGFLMNDKRNKNGWRVTWEGIKKYASDFVNHPGIWYETGSGPDHTGGDSYRENMSNQENYRVVNIVDVMVDEDTKTLNYVGEILDMDFEQLWREDKINMTSPAVWPIEMKEVGKMPDGRPMLDVFVFRALHVAYIDEPAYGEDANTISVCDGDGIACQVRLSAKTNGGGLCADDNLAPLMEVPLIKKKLQSTYSSCELKRFHDELMASTDESDCVANKLKIVMQDNADIEKDQALAIAYSFCQKEGIEKVLADQKY